LHENCSLQGQLKASGQLWPPHPRILNNPKSLHLLGLTDLASLVVIPNINLASASWVMPEQAWGAVGTLKASYKNWRK